MPISWCSPFQYDCPVNFADLTLNFRKTITDASGKSVPSREDGASQIAGDSHESVSSREDCASQVRHEHVYRMREFYFKERSRYIIGPWTYTFVLQAATQVSPGTGISAEAAEEAQGTEDNAGGDGGNETDDDDEEHHDSDKYDSDGTEKKAESGQKRYRKFLHSGSNAVAHALVKRCMGLWLRDAIGPLMGEGPATAQRNAIAIQAIKQFKIRDLHDFTQGKDPKMERRLKDCATQADKVLQSLRRVRYAFHAA